MDEFYRRIKLKGHFQDTRKQTDLSDEEHRFNSKNKHWVPTKIHHTIGIFIEATTKNENSERRKRPQTILADKHFQTIGHRFNKHARFRIVGKLTNKLWQRNLKRTSYSKRKLLDTKIRHFLS